MIETLYAAAGGQGGSAGNPIVGMLPLILILAIMYFLILRPQAKKQKERQKMLDALKKGDDVITAGGLHGKIVGFKNDDKVVVLKIGDNVKVDVERSAIASVKRQA